MYGIRFGGGRVEILTFIIVNGVITPPYSKMIKMTIFKNGLKTQPKVVNASNQR